MKTWKRVQKRTGRRAMRVRNRVRGTQDKPRLSVFRSNMHIYAQIIDDESGRTIVQCSSRDLTRDGKLTAKYSGNRDAAKEVGMAVAAVAKENGVTSVCFDRGSYRYHGRVAALAEGAREGGLEF
ncbi:MAG: 50S ribosomal protein L18 [Planctomycetota bacterium]